MRPSVPTAWLLLGVALWASSVVPTAAALQTSLRPAAASGRRREAAPVVCQGVTKRNRRRVNERNTGGSVGENARRKRESEFPARVFFANVKYDVTEETLAPFFGAVGPVTHCKIVRDSFTGRSKGYGFVTYADPIYATTALRSLHGRSVEGREIRLDDATSLAKRRKEKKATEAFEKREAKRQARAAEEAGDAAGVDDDEAAAGGAAGDDGPAP